MQQTLVLVLSMLMGYSTSLKSQETALPASYTIEVGIEDNLGTLIEHFSSRGQFQFAFAPALLNLKPQVVGLVTGQDPEDILDQLFIDSINIDVRNGNQILIRSGITAKERIPIPAYWSIDVRDAETGEPVADVIVSMYEEVYQTLTDEDGKALIPKDLGLGKDKVHLNCIGYHAESIAFEEVVAGKSVSLAPDPIELEEIVIVASLENRVTEDFAFDGSAYLPNINSIAGGAGSDPIRAVQFLPGIQADDDLSSEVKIRGSEGSETLLLLDGIPIHNAEHYYGIFSNINGGYIREAVLYKNVVPVQYGGKTGGLLALNSADQVDAFSGSIEANLIYSNINLNIPLGEKLTFNVAGRASYFNAAESQVFDFIENRNEAYRNSIGATSRDKVIKSLPFFNFYDGNAKLSFKPNENTEIDLNLFSSQDHFENDYTLSFLSTVSDREVQGRELSNNTEDWNNLGASVNLKSAISNNWSLVSSTYFSRFSNNNTVASSLRRSEIQQTGFSNEQDNSLSEIGGLAYLEGKLNPATFVIGLSTKYLASEFSLTEDAESVIESATTGWESSMFTSLSSKVKAFAWTINLRLNHYTETRGLYLDPSLQVSYKIHPNAKLKSAIGFSHQFVRELNYESRLTQSFDYFVLANDSRFPIGTSFNKMIGLQWKENRWLFDLEFYHRKIDGVIEYALQSPGFSDNIGPSTQRNYGIFQGQGWVRGVDVYINYRQPSFHSSLAYTLSSNTRQLDQIRRNTIYASEDDRRHQIKWSNVWTMGDFRFTGNLVYSSGKPYLDLSLLSQGQDRENFTRDEFLDYLPSYERVDLGVDYTFDLGRTKMQVGLSCFNVFNRENVKYIQYIYSIPSNDRIGNAGQSAVGTEAGLLPRTFNATLNVSF